MSSISGIGSALNYAADALSVHSVGIQVSAHNIANVNTGDFLPQRATLATGPKGLGVDLESIAKAPALPDTHPSGELGRFLGDKAPSTTEISREMPSLLLSERAFQANVATIRTSDEMYGTLLNTTA